MTGFSDKAQKLACLLRVRSLEVVSSQHQAARTRAELAAATAACTAAAERQDDAMACEAAALQARNAAPGDPGALLHCRASASRTREAAAALDDCRSGEADAAEAARNARRLLVRAEARHECIQTRLKSERIRLRSRAERRRDDEPRRAVLEAWR